MSADRKVITALISNVGQATAKLTTLVNPPDDIRQLRRERVYLEFRLPGLDGELRSLKDERKKINVKLQAGLGAAEAKALKMRKLFITARVEKLKAEKDSLIEEHERIKGQLREYPVAEGKL